ncbi:hypothetical protein EI982_13795 [Haloplanus rallus]|jgi:hypothetical protein|uniref:Uncharacterized protein n=1 Tax=Haloplanus rallus TaxID=1816183 RepID=A0A6B9FBI4_9EURY|nr:MULTISPECIES: hypothetical protein [Haloplanus]QGX95781.1 hypothetical protein EI982_13795 [Haloplanus rallus]
MGPLQTGVGSAPPLAVAGTVALFALFLSVTAHIAARNVLGDVPIKNAFLIGPVPAAVAVVAAALELPSIPAVLVALGLDAVLVHYVYDLDRRLTAGVTAIHAVVSVILGSVVFSLYVLVRSAPG